MGFLRTYLALIVVLAHITVFDQGLKTPFMGGAILAVKFFFLLSGFYMSLVLDLKYRHRTFEFYKSRFFRLYPLYWVTCLLVLGTVFVQTENQYASELLKSFSRIDSLYRQILVWLSNITFLGSDLLKFIYFNNTDPSQLIFFPEKPPDGSSNHQWLVVLPAWTLGIEVMFYLCAPFLFRKGWHGILLLLAVSVSSRMFLFGIGYNSNDWERHFILSEAIYFALGMASYRIYKLMPPHVFTKAHNWLAAVVIFAWMTMFAYIYIRNVNVGDRQIWQALYHWGFMAVAVVTVPFLFEWSRKSRTDFYVGEFSYPIYITHLPTLLFVLPLFRGTMQDWSFTGKLAFSLGVVIAVAALGIALVSYPVEWLRGRKTMQSRHATLPP